MGRLIDADALKEHIKDVPTWTQQLGEGWKAQKYPNGMYDPEDVLSSIDNAQTIETVPVRCRDCVHAVEIAGVEKHLIRDGAKKCAIGRGSEIYGVSVVLEYQYCDEGERRDDREER